jgi:hypothetical protein
VETYLRVTFFSEGSKPSEVADRLRSLGFQPTQGNYDFVLDWKRMVTPEEALMLADEVTKSLQGYKVLFELETV